MRFLKRLLITLFVIYLLGGFVIVFFQKKLLFRPTILAKDHHYEFDNPFSEENIAFDSSSNIAIVRFPTSDSVVKGVVLYFYGNRRNAERYAWNSPNFTHHGYEVWMMDYPGYGKSTGKFEEQRFYDYAAKVYALATSKVPGRVIIYGKSLGTCVATQLASAQHCDELILETPYYSLPSLLMYYAPIYPAELLFDYHFPTWQYLGDVKAHVTIFSGTEDWVTPIDNAKRLIPYLKKGDMFITIEGGRHYGIPGRREYWTVLDSLLVNGKAR